MDDQVAPPTDALEVAGLEAVDRAEVPDIVFARFDYAYDETQEGWFEALGIRAGDLLSRVETNETQIETAGVNVHSYIAPGYEHVVLSDGPFYTETVNGESWSTGLPG